MPTTVEIQAFKFQELTDKAKQEVITRLAPEYEWWDGVYDNAKEDGVDKGFRIDDIRFEGFYSQGDGASWQGKVDMLKWFELHRPTDPKARLIVELIEDDWVARHLTINYSSSRYAHSNTMKHEWLIMGAPYEDSTVNNGPLKGANVQELFDAIGTVYFDDVCDDALQSARNYADEIYYLLRKEYEHLCSEEVIAELCDANEYLFTEDGKFV